MSEADTPRTMVRTMVAPSDNGPVTVGVVRVIRLRGDLPPIVRTFDTPRPEFVGVEFDRWSDADIESLRA